MENHPTDSDETSGGLSDQVGGPQASDQEILEKILEGKEYSETFVFESEYGDLEFDLTPITNREDRYEYISKLPDGLFNAGEDVDISEMENASDSVPDREGIKALQDMVIQSAESATIAPSEIKLLVEKRMSDEVVMEAAGRVLEMSMGSQNDINGFRRKE